MPYLMIFQSGAQWCAKIWKIIKYARNMCKKMKKSRLKLALNAFFGWCQAPKNPISGTMYPVPSLFVIESHVICPYPLSHNRNIHSRSGSNIQELKFDAYKIIYRDFRFRELYTIYRYLKFFFHVLRKLSTISIVIYPLSLGE